MQQAQWLQADASFSAIDATYYGFTAELNTSGSGSPYLSHDEIDTMAVLIYMRDDYGVDESKLTSSAGALFRTIENVTVGNFASAVKNGVQFINDLRASQTRLTQGQSENINRNFPFNKFYQLRANIPRRIIFASNVSGLAGGYGPSFSNHLIFKSNFFLGLKISTELTYYGPIANTIPIGSSQDCCNEAYGSWFNAGENESRYEANRIDLENFFRFDLVNGSPYDWASANGGLVESGELTIGSTNTVGSVYTLNKCGCEAFIYEIGGLQSILKPEFTLSSQNDCSPIELIITNHTDFMNISGATIEIVDNQGNIVGSGTSSIYNLNLNAGDYFISFVDPETGCRSTIPFKINLCPSWTGDEVACLEDALTVYPNPIPNNFEYLTIELCFYCNDENLTPNFMKSKFLPAQIKAYDAAIGTLQFTSGNVFLGALDDNDCIREEIDLTQLSGFPIASGTVWIVQVEFVGGLILNRTITFN